ncbi:MAG TPA: (2Fe-2S)-binding protein, partial [Chloroflexota bacterium]|nr:(2Fe-2S)-binding protein [Chloroflexota bacterium]
EPGEYYWRIAQFLMPFYTMPPQNILGLPTGPRAWVPMDDTHTMVFSVGAKGSQNWQPGAPVNPGLMAGTEQLPQTTDWFGRFRLAANASNDYKIDREAQRKMVQYTGIFGINLQDQAVTESMGDVFDRSIEHLGTSDSMIIRVRRRLLNAARSLRDHGLTPPGVDDPEAYRVRAGGVILPVDADWVEATKELRKAYVEHQGLDVAIGG